MSYYMVFYCYVCAAHYNASVAEGDEDASDDENGIQFTARSGSNSEGDIAGMDKMYWAAGIISMSAPAKLTCLWLH